MPTVSVIVPNYNHAPFLQRRIDSILGQTYQDFELILLDDCSTDNSPYVLASYSGDPRVRLHFNEENSGTPFKQWNKGVRMAQGRYVWIAESDDYADSCFLARTVRILEEQREVTYAYCRSKRVGEDDQFFGFADSDFDRLAPNHWAEDFLVDGLEECRRFFVLTSPVPNASAVLFRKEVYEKVGLAEEQYRICGDYKVWAAMAMRGKVAYVAEPLNYFRAHRRNVRSQTRAGALDVAEYFHAMLSVLSRIASPGLGSQSATAEEILGRPLIDLSPHERIKTARQSLSFIADWNLRHNSYVSHDVMRAYFGDWEFALIGREFAICPPSRWRFFSHRLRFYRHYAPGMSWKTKLVNLGRIFGAPLVGYQHKHWPEEIYAQVTRTLEALLGRQNPGAKP